MTDAFGGRGGIAKYNRDFLAALSSSSEFTHTILLMRRFVDVPGTTLGKLSIDYSSTAGAFRYLASCVRVLYTYSDVKVVVCGHLNLLPAAWIISAIKKAPLVCVVHGIEAWQPHKSLLVNKLIKRIDRLFSVSDLTKTRFQSWANLDETRITLLPNSYDAQIFFPEPTEDGLSKKYGLSGRSVLLTFARLDSKERYKGIDEVLDVMRDLVAERANIVYLICGEGPDRSRLEAKVEALGLSSNVIFAGYVEEHKKRAHYNLADVFVMPSSGEGFGIVFLEALACGLPAIGGAFDGAREALAGGQLGALVNPTDREELKGAIRKALVIKERSVPQALPNLFSLASFNLRLKSALVSLQNRSARDA
jgi:glycosyltransferase involved in cell wall biosynthesis